MAGVAKSLRALRALLTSEESETPAIELIIYVPAAREAAYAWLATRLQNIHASESFFVVLLGG
jgi:hypothetical protein